MPRSPCARSFTECLEGRQSLRPARRARRLGSARDRAGAGRAGLRELLHVLPGAAQDATVWGRAFDGAARALLLLPVSTCGSAIWVLLYIWATGRVDYPWIARNRAA